MEKTFNNYGTLYNLDCMTAIRQQPDNSVDCVITSPPYWQLRDYGYPEQWGLEPTYKEYLAHLQELMTEIWRVLKPQGTVWVNLGDSYSSNHSGGNYDCNKHKRNENNFVQSKNIDLPSKCLMLIPHRFAIDCIDNGWILRNDIIWAKPNGMPESVTDRFSKKHEFMFFFVKQQKYYFDLDSVREKHTTNKNNKILQRGSQKWNSGLGQPQQSHINGVGKHELGKNCGDVADFWEIPTKPSANEHYASYNFDLIKKPILAGCPQGGVIYDPFMGSGTTAIAAIHYGRKFIGSEMSKDYFEMSLKNIQNKILSTPENLF